jgi:hypothetical protein
MRIKLLPSGFALGMVIDIVAKHHHSAPIAKRALVAKCSTGPVLIEGQRLTDFHGIYASACRLETPPSHSDYPVTYLSAFANGRLARGQRTDTVEGVGREAKVPIHHIHEDPRH